MEQAVKSFWRRRRKRAVILLLKGRKENLLTVMPKYFSEQKRLDKTERWATVAEYIKRTYSWRRGSQRRFVDLYSKNERKISKTETKILTHALGLSEKQSSHRSDDEEPNQPTTESKFVESWKEKRPTKRKRDRDTYLSPPSRKRKFEIKMKNKENAKVETSKKANSSKKK